MPLIVARLCGADLGLDKADKTDLKDWVGDAVETTTNVVPVMYCAYVLVCPAACSCIF